MRQDAQSFDEAHNREAGLHDAFNPEAGVSAAQIGQALYHKKGMILGVTLAALLLSTAYVTLSTPRYTAEATVLIENQENYFTRPDATANSNPVSPPDTEAVQTQIQLVQSRDLALQAIKELNLVGNPEFDPLAGGSSAFSRVMSLLGLAPNPGKTSREDGILALYFQKLAVTSPLKTRVLNIDFNANDPALAARGANTVAQLYLDRQSGAKRDAAKQAAMTLSSQIDALRLRLADAEATAEQFRLQSGLLVGANNLTISAQQLGDINTQLSSARTAEAEAKAKADLLRQMVRQGRIREVPDVANNDLIRRIDGQRIALSAELARQSRTLLPGHPVIKELTAQMTDLDNQLRLAANKTALTLENDARLASMKVKNLQATLEAQKAVAGTSNSNDVTLRQYDNAARLLKNELDADTTKFQEAKAREAAVSTPADARMVSRAEVPSLPSFPKKLPIIAASTLAGLIFSSGFVITGKLLGGSGEFSRPMPQAPGDVPMPGEDAVVVEPNATAQRRKATPTDKDKPHSPGIAPVPAPNSEDLRNAQIGEYAHHIEAAASSGHAIVTIVVGPDIGAQAQLKVGSDALALARELGQMGRSILVSLNPEEATIDRLVVGYEGIGLATLLAGHNSFAEVIHRDPDSRLHLICHGDGNIEGIEGLDQVLDALCETYDHVILVGPALGSSTLTSDFASYSDFAVISSARHPSDQVIEAAREDLVRSGVGEVITLCKVPGLSASRAQTAA